MLINDKTGCELARLWSRVVGPEEEEEESGGVRPSLTAFMPAELWGCMHGLSFYSMCLRACAHRDRHNDRRQLEAGQDARTLVGSVFPRTESSAEDSDCKCFA